MYCRIQSEIHRFQNHHCMLTIYLPYTFHTPQFSRIKKAESHWNWACDHRKNYNDLSTRENNIPVPLGLVLKRIEQNAHLYIVKVTITREIVNNNT
jgi:hypothetical protein